MPAREGSREKPIFGFRRSENYYGEPFIFHAAISIMKKQRKGLRTLFYFRMGYSTYLVLVLGAVNVLTSTYFLAIDKIPSIKEIFPTFEMYALTAIVIAIPVVTATGYVHYKRIGAHSASRAIAVQNFIFNYRMAPGFTLEAFGPAHRLILRAVLKRANSEKLTEDEIKEIDNIMERLRHLIDGGAVGKYAKGVIDD